MCIMVSQEVVFSLYLRTLLWFAIFDGILAVSYVLTSCVLLYIFMELCVVFHFKTMVSSLGMLLNSLCFAVLCLLFLSERSLSFLSV